MASSQYLYVSSLLGILLLASYVLAEDGNGKDHKKPEFTVPRFIYPAREGMAFFSQDTVNVSYYSDFEKPTLYFWCIVSGVSQRLGMLQDFPSNNGWNLVRMPSGVDSNNCWFNLQTSDDEFNSVPFSLSSTEKTEASKGSGPVETHDGSQTAAASPSETQGQVTGTEESATTTTSTPQASSQAGSQEDEAEDSDSQGMSESVKIGIAVGVSLGILGTVALISTSCMLRRQKKSPAAGCQPVDQSHGPHMVTYYSNPDPQQLPEHLREWYVSKPAPRKQERESLQVFELP